ncbi:MAG TPA: hypothetical protein VGB37_13845, partial [Candidatus Lokiarchaeia archaeon]
MINNNIVIILGAGANKPFGFPTGDELSKMIAHNFKDQYLSLMAKSYTPNYAFWDLTYNSVNFLVENLRGTSLGIDSFLAKNKHLTSIGKKAILFLISLMERENKLPWEDSNKSFDWFSPLFNKMAHDLPNLSYFGNNKISFISFNYDRLLEHVLFHNLKSTFTQKSETDISEQLNLIPFIHVYGKVSNLPWQGGKFYPYGHDFDFETINNIYNNIK